jgi:hypothetical protein
MYFAAIRPGNAAPGTASTDYRRYTTVQDSRDPVGPLLRVQHSVALCGKAPSPLVYFECEENVRTHSTELLAMITGEPPGMLLSWC